MKKVIYLFIFSVFLFTSCDNVGNYTFIIKNSTKDTLTLKFVNELHYSYISENQEEVSLLPEEEKTVRIIEAPLNSPAHDCLAQHQMAYFNGLIFETYIEEEKLEKQLWEPENWTYRKRSKWAAEYKMAITNEMIEVF